MQTGEAGASTDLLATAATKLGLELGLGLSLGPVLQLRMEPTKHVRQLRTGLVTWDLLRFTGIKISKATKISKDFQKTKHTHGSSTQNINLMALTRNVTRYKLEKPLPSFF